MKKSIKRLSAILAILVLSMTLAVPVTAVESNDFAMDEASLYGVQRLDNVYLSYYEDEILVLEGSCVITYLDSNKAFHISTTAYLPDGATEFVGFSCESIGLAYYIFEEVKTDSFTAEDIADDMYDSLVAHASTTLFSSNVQWVRGAGYMYYGGEDADAFGYEYSAGSDFTY